MGVTWQSRRLSVLKQFGRLIIDAVSVPVLLAPLLPTLYKLPGLCTRMVAMSKKAKRGDPAFRCEACNVSIPERGKISLALTLRRRQGATADGPVGHLQNLGLRVLGSTSFWASAAEASSDLIVAAAKAMMPVQCKPNDFDAGALAQETEDTVSFHVALPFVTKRTSLEKKLKVLGTSGHTILVNAECHGLETPLFCLPIPLASIFAATTSATGHAEIDARQFEEDAVLKCANGIEPDVVARDKLVLQLAIEDVRLFIDIARVIL